MNTVIINNLKCYGKLRGKTTCLFVIKQISFLCLKIPYDKLLRLKEQYLKYTRVKYAQLYETKNIDYRTATGMYPVYKSMKTKQMEICTCKR